MPCTTQMKLKPSQGRHEHESKSVFPKESAVSKRRGFMSRKRMQKVTPSSRFRSDLMSICSVKAVISNELKGAMVWCWGDENSHREAKNFLDLMDREEMERLQPAVYDGANYVAGEAKEHAQLEEASQKDLSEELDEKAEARNDQIRDELLAKACVEKELGNAHEEIRILEKKLERVTGDLETANEKLLEKSDLGEYVESADNEIQTLWAELDSVKAENKRLKTKNVCQKAALESELNAAVEVVYRIGTKLDTVVDENSKLKTELLIKKDVECDLKMAEEELEKLWKEVDGVKAENRRLKRDFSEERATRNTLMKADEKNIKLWKKILGI
ncbi:peptidoglycan DL-endopeptidase CwlO-like [Palaemon carinicauda]|uniref:peptidoglycan DL-endopeptidase CwlO-like n=1 Tax=Palaemon carinicauda TaxID=392227 RepID=UPI0035B5DEEB